MSIIRRADLDRLKCSEVHILEFMLSIDLELAQTILIDAYTSVWIFKGLHEQGGSLT